MYGIEKKKIEAKNSLSLRITLQVPLLINIGTSNHKGPCTLFRIEMKKINSSHIVPEIEITTKIVK